MRTATLGQIEVAFSGKRASFPLNAQFSILAKGVAGIFGPPGCGKTTVARCIAGLERFSAGFCVIDGEVWQDETTFRAPHLRPIGYVLRSRASFRICRSGATCFTPPANAIQDRLRLMR